MPVVVEDDPVVPEIVCIKQFIHKCTRCGMDAQRERAKGEVQGVWVPECQPSFWEGQNIA